MDRVIDEIIEIKDRLWCSPIYVEENGDKGFLKKELIRRRCFAVGYTETQNKVIKITTYLRKWWPNVVFLQGTDPEYIRQILDYSPYAEHDDAADSAACVARILDARNW